MARKFRSPVDPYILMMIATVVIASIIPAVGVGAVIANWAATLAIAILFFMYGAKLSPQAALIGLTHWRLHGVVLLCTFVLFPLMGLALGFLPESILPRSLYNGLLFLCVLPSTVQSSIAFTSIARGNVAAALCSASASNLLGIFVTPLLAALLLHTQSGGFSFGVLLDIVTQLLLPFMAGQALRPWINRWLTRNKSSLSFVDRGSILLVIYTAFSEGVVSGVWHQLDLANLGMLFVVSLVLLLVVLAITTILSRYVLRFPVEDEIVVVFCGSKKSLASGLPMASVLFAGSQVGLIVLPLMLFHQMQLMLCATLARRYGARPAVPDALTHAVLPSGKVA